MSKEKQIEEISNVIYDDSNINDTYWRSHCEQLAETIYNAGYRKQSEVAKEVFDNIKEKLIFNTYGIATISNKTFCELKKKYTEES